MAKKNSVVIASGSCRERRSIGSLSSPNHPRFKLRYGCLGYAWSVVIFCFLLLTSSIPARAQTFSDDFNRPDGDIGNGWGSWNGSTLANGQLQTFGSDGAGGGIFRTFPVTLPLKFSFDFRSESPHPSCDIGNNLPGGGWLIAFNAPGAGFAGAQIEFLQFYGSQFVLRQYQTSAGTFADILPSSSPDFGPAFVHISGTVNADLSATLTIGSATYDFPPVASPLAAATGSNLAVSNSSCGGGPFFFDNLSVTNGCQVTANEVNVYADGPLSRDLHHTSMNATFTPTGSSLPDLAAACGFTGFDWVQLITQWPSPSGLFAMSDPTTPITLPPPSNINDPPSGGYTYPESQQPPFLQAFPFYYNATSIPLGCAIQQNDGTCIERIMSGPSTLNFYDSPKNGCLVNSPPSACQGIFTLTPAFMAFTTQLVGICNASQSAMCSSPGKPSVPLFQWTWNDNFNGTTGGVFGVQTASSPPDPDSGTGGITITSINGVRQMPPSVNCTATPNTLWPPDGKSVSVSVSGSVTAGTSALVPGKTNFTVADSQREPTPSGSIPLGSDGSYSFTVPLSASRDGNDKNGRQYTIAVTTSDQIGNVGSCSIVVTVPHDQGH